ncbi:MAG: ABC transporter permease [Hyphomicrobiaceae bacterium]
MTGQSFDWRLMARLALRDLRGGLRGFSVFVICVALGVAVIAAVGVISDSLQAGFAAEGREMLGGDVAVSRVHGRASQVERDDLEALGAVSEVATLRGMAQPVAGAGNTDFDARVMVEVKAVDGAYPLAGFLEGGTTPSPLQAMRNGHHIVVAPILMERMKLKIGDTLRLGSARLTIVDTIKVEPDGLSGRAAFGPRVLMSLETLKATGLVTPGSLVRWRYRVLLPSDAGEEKFLTSATRIKAVFAQRGFSVRDRRNPAPGITTAIDRFRQFLTLVGLTAMLVGGVGVANAVSAYLDDKRMTIATFQAIGAGRRMIFLVYLAEILMIAALGIGLGLLFGLGLPYLGWQFAGASVPIPVQFTIQPKTLLIAASYGFLVSLAFVLWPLGRIDQVRPAVLFRDTVAPERNRPQPAILAVIAVVLGVLVLLTVVGNERPMIAMAFFGGIAALFAIFAGLAWLIRWAARRVPRPRSPEFALAVRNLSGPGSLTQAIVLSLGTGLSLLVAVTLTDASLVGELTTRLPDKAPSFYFLDVNKSSADAFRAEIGKAAPGASLRQAPMLRGRIVTLGGVPSDKITAPPESRWVLNGDRGLTFATTVPEGSRLVEGTWWAEDYSGEPLVSFEAAIARGLGLKIGDEVTVNVLGRPVTAKIANLREVNWGSLSINFVLVYSPNTLQAAPYNYLLTLAYDTPPSLADEARVLRAVGTAFPAVTAIRVRDAIDAVAKILERVMLAIRGLGGLTLLVGAVVLAGAITTSQRRRTGQAVLLKTLGATRRRVLASGLYEFLILGLCVSLVAVLLGALAAWAITTFAMDVTFHFAPVAVLEALILALGLTLLLGGFSLRRILAARPVPYLRTA